jgi:hypothetical protein
MLKMYTPVFTLCVVCCAYVDCTHGNACIVQGVHKRILGFYLLIMKNKTLNMEHTLKCTGKNFCVAKYGKKVFNKYFIFLINK